MEVKQKKASKNYICEVCHCQIDAGETYTDCSQKNPDGTWTHQRYHNPCFGNNVGLETQVVRRLSSKGRFKACKGESNYWVLGVTYDDVGQVNYFVLGQAGSRTTVFVPPQQLESQFKLFL